MKYLHQARSFTYIILQKDIIFTLQMEILKLKVIRQLDQHTHGQDPNLRGSVTHVFLGRTTGL